MRLYSVGIRVRNLQRSVAFYTKALGLRVVRRDDCRSWGGGVAVLLEDPASRRVLELNWYPPGSRFSERYRAGSELDHIDVSVGAAPASALDRAYRRLIRRGARPTRLTPSTTGGWAAVVRDPDGLWIRIGRDPQPSKRGSSP